MGKISELVAELMAKIEASALFTQAQQLADRLPGGQSLLVPASAALFGYWVLVRLLRYRRRDTLARRYGYPTRSSYARMTLADAQRINAELATQEFPATFQNSVFFALLKTYGIPTISALLARTGEFVGEATAARRAADTAAVIGEASFQAPGSARAVGATARMNFLHARYRKAGKILDDDMLYTLSLFVLEPIRWTALFEWRALTDLERCAMAVLWREIGADMEIDYGCLEPAMGGRDDGLAWLDALDQWRTRYEMNCMLPAESNKKVADATLKLALFYLPSFAYQFGLRAVGVLLEPHLRRAVMMPEPTAFETIMVNSLVALRKFALRNFFLPRPKFLAATLMTDEADPKTGRFYSLTYTVQPWYVKPTLWSRWGPQAWLTWALGGTLPGDGGDRFHPEGYAVADLGPEHMRGKGADEVDRFRRKIWERRSAGGGCPMHVVKGA